MIVFLKRLLGLWHLEPTDDMGYVPGDWKPVPGTVIPNCGERR